MTDVAAEKVKGDGFGNWAEGKRFLEHTKRPFEKNTGFTVSGTRC
jgi:hypothetical protein